MPFLHTCSHLIKKAINNSNIILTDKPLTPLNNIIPKIKQRNEKRKTMNSIYSVKCQDCNSVYIGQTGVYLRQRLYFHRSQAKNNHVLYMLAKHVRDTGHSPDYSVENVEILDKSDNLKMREFLEACYIRQYEETALNNKNDIKGLCITYANLLNLQKARNLRFAQNN